MKKILLLAASIAGIIPARVQASLAPDVTSCTKQFSKTQAKLRKAVEAQSRIAFQADQSADRAIEVFDITQQADEDRLNKVIDEYNANLDKRRANLQSSVEAAADRAEIAQAEIDRAERIIANLTVIGF